MEAFDELASDAPSWYAGILAVLGRGKNDEALRQAREQLTISKENVDKASELVALRLVVKAQLGKGDAWNGKNTAEEALTLAKASGNKKALAGAWHMLAKAELSSKNPSAALAAAKEAESGYSGYQAGIAAVMCTVASVQSFQKEQDKALETSSAARKIFKDIGEYSGEASALKIAVDMKMAEDRYYHALLLVEDMAKLYNQGSDMEGEAAAQLLAAELQVMQGDLQNAMDRASAAAELFDQVGNPKKKGAAVLVMAKAFEGAGQMQDATQAAEAACGLFQEGRDKRGQAAALLVLSSTLNTQSQYGASAYKLEEAAFVFRQLKDKKEEANIMARWAAETLKMLGNQAEMPIQGWGNAEKELVVKNAARAVELFGETGSKGSVEYARALLTQSHGLNLLGRHDEAIAKAGEAQTIFEEKGDLSGQSSALESLGNAYMGKRSSDAAIEALEKSRELAEEAGEGLSIKEVSKKIKDIGRYKASKQRAGQEGPRQDISIIRWDVPIIVYDAFEGRQMRTGPAGGASSSAPKPGDKDYVVPARQKVMYNLRMQRKPNVDMTSMPAITA